MVDELHLYTYLGERDGPNANRHFEATVTPGKPAHYHISHDTLLFLALPGAPKTLAVTLADLSTTGTNVVVHPTFHAAVTALARYGQPQRHVTLYVLATVRAIHVVLRTKKGSAMYTKAQRAEDISHTKKFPTQMLVPPSEKTAVGIRYMVVLPVDPVLETAPADSARLAHAFVPGLYTTPVVRTATTTTTTTPPPFDPLTFDVQRGQSGPTESPLRRLAEAMPLPEAVSKGDPKEARRFRKRLRRLDNSEGLASLARIVHTYTHVAEALASRNVGDDHLRFLQLCTQSAEPTQCPEAGLFAWIRGVGHWPNRTVLWFSTTPSDSPPQAPSFHLAVHTLDQTDASHHFVHASGALGLGFVALQSEFQATDDPLHRQLSVLAAADIVPYPAARVVRDAISAATLTFLAANATHADRIVVLKGTLRLDGRQAQPSILTLLAADETLDAAGLVRQRASLETPTAVAAPPRAMAFPRRHVTGPMHFVGSAASAFYLHRPLPPSGMPDPWGGTHKRAREITAKLPEEDRAHAAKKVATARARLASYV